MNTCAIEMLKLLLGGFHSTSGGVVDSAVPGDDAADRGGREEESTAARQLPPRPVKLRDHRLQVPAKSRRLARAVRTNALTDATDQLNVLAHARLFAQSIAPPPKRFFAVAT
jgi:hypothetical protein